MQMLFGAQMQRSVCVASRLGIPDLLATQSQTAEDSKIKLTFRRPI